MNTRIIALSFFLILLIFNNLYAQTGGNGDPVIPLQQNRSVLFGSDIVIHDQPVQDQRNVVLRSAFNGWLYAGYTYENEINHFPAITIMKSIDNGINWTLLIDMYQPFDNTEIRSVDFTVCGDSVSNIKLFLAFVIVGKGSTTGIGDGYVLRFNGSTGTYEDQLQPTLSSVYCVSLSSDFMFPAINSNPYSLGCIYSYHFYQYPGDSLVFHSSSNGGLYFDNRKVIAGTSNRYHKVALAYGRGLSSNSGRYFAAWEELADFGSITGHIYTAHSEPNFNSPFTPPVRIDSLEATAYNNARNPSIACQFNNIDNDSSNLTEIVLFDKYMTSSNSYDIQGCFNMKSTLTNHFIPFSLSSSLESKMEPSIIFNPFDSTFMVTYYNSTSQELPFLHKNFNIVNPETWEVITPAYNDSSNLVDPYPKISLNIGQKQVVMAWACEGSGGNGISLFDAPYMITGISKTDNNLDMDVFVAYPNPCNSSLKIAFEIQSQERLKITLYNLTGQLIGTLADQLFKNGKYLINYNVSVFPSGIYFISFRTESNSTARKLFIVR